MTATALPFRTKAFIDGDFTDTVSGETFDTLAPANGEVLATVAAGSAEDVDRAVRAARNAFVRGHWAGMAPRDRRRILLTLAERIEADATQLALIDAVDAGKPIVDCETGDIPSVLRTLRWFAETLDKLYDRIGPTGPDNLALIVRQPVGVVGAVVPWNYPASTVMGKIAPALAAGNSVVVKPAELAPLSALRLAELAAEAGIPDGVLNVVPGLGEVAGRAVGMHPDVDAVTFTGSTEVGREFLRYTAASNLKRVVLELGGKSPQIVMADADPVSVAPELARAAFSNMGENCTCGSNILVHRSIRTELVDALRAQVPAWRVGDPLERTTRLGPLISKSQMDKVIGYIQQAEQQGATIASGGGRVLEETGGWYVAPTVLENVTPDMRVAQEEIFGPVVSIMEFDDESEAVRLANSTKYGLAASLYTQDMRVAHRMARSIRAGTVSINCYSEGDISTPFGGWKESGFGGKDKGMEAFDQYTELKTIWYAM